VCTSIFYSRAYTLHIFVQLITWKTWSNKSDIIVTLSWHFLWCSPYDMRFKEQKINLLAGFEQNNSRRRYIVEQNEVFFFFLFSPSSLIFLRFFSSFYSTKPKPWQAYYSLTPVPLWLRLLKCCRTLDQDLIYYIGPWRLVLQFLGGMSGSDSVGDKGSPTGSSWIFMT